MNKITYMLKNRMQTHTIKHVVVLHINYAYCPNKGQVNRKNITPTEYKLSIVCPYNLAKRNRKNCNHRRNSTFVLSEMLTLNLNPLYLLSLLLTDLVQLGLLYKYVYIIFLFILGVCVTSKKNYNGHFYFFLLDFYGFFCNFFLGGDWIFWIFFQIAKVTTIFSSYKNY